MSIAIIDYGAGNTKSVQFALDRINEPSIVTADPKIIKKAKGVIFPGVGHAKPAMKVLKEKGLDKVIPELNQTVLGVCLGMQLMCKKSEEGDAEGLGIFDAEIVRFNSSLNVPQMGWNKLKTTDSPLFKGVEEGYVYFVHSYYAKQCKETIGLTNYGGVFSAALQKDNFYGCQFHPEKSGLVGEQILKNFIELCD